MNGAEHYYEGDRLMQKVDASSNWSDKTRAIIAEAQAHYTAALAAAVAANRFVGPLEGSGHHTIETDINLLGGGYQ